jgi:ribosomal protein S18 acetylase RimI-like enzyme
MLKQSEVTIRDVDASEADAIADLHTLSWRIAYRGLLSDEYLDKNVQEERRRHWAQKMPALTEKEFVLAAEQDGKFVGFVAVLDKPEAGFDALVDNLHVRPDLKGLGIGGKLLNAVADRLLKTNRKSFYLFVLKGNTSAENFYLAKGGKRMDTWKNELGGMVVEATRFAWDELERMR